MIAYGSFFHFFCSLPRRFCAFFWFQGETFEIETKNSMFLNGVRTEYQCVISHEQYVLGSLRTEIETVISFSMASKKRNEKTIRNNKTVCGFFHVFSF